MSVASIEKPSRNRIRQAIGRTLLTDADLHAFCIDYFYDSVANRFTDSMDRIVKINLLLSLEEPNAIQQALQDYDASRKSDRHDHSGSYSLINSLFQICDADLQDAFTLAINASRRQGNSKVSTKMLLSSIMKLEPEISALFPSGSLPIPLSEPISLNRNDFESSIVFSKCVSDSIEKLRPKASISTPITNQDILLDLAKYGTGSSVKTLREHGVGPAEVDQLAVRMGHRGIRRD